MRACTSLKKFCCGRLGGSSWAGAAAPASAGFASMASSRGRPPAAARSSSALRWRDLLRLARGAEIEGNAARPLRRQAGPDDSLRRPRAARARRAARRADRTRSRRSSRRADPARSGARRARLQLLDQASSVSPVCRTIDPIGAGERKSSGMDAGLIIYAKIRITAMACAGKQACIFLSIQPQHSRSFAGEGVRAIGSNQRWCSPSGGVEWRRRSTLRS